MRGLVAHAIITITVVEIIVHTILFSSSVRVVIISAGRSSTTVVDIVVHRAPYTTFVKTQRTPRVAQDPHFLFYSASYWPSSFLSLPPAWSLSSLSASSS